MIPLEALAVCKRGWGDEEEEGEEGGEGGGSET